MLSSFPSALTKVNRMVSIKVNGVDTWQLQEFDQISIAKVYNKVMGGTDSEDQRLAYYRPKLKTISHAPRIFSHFISASFINAFTIMCSHRNLNSNNFRYIDFLNNLIMQLVTPWLTKLAEGGVMPNNNGGRARNRTTKAWNNDQLRLVGRHLPLCRCIAPARRMWW